MPLCIFAFDSRGLPFVIRETKLFRNLKTSYDNKDIGNFFTKKYFAERPGSVISVLPLILFSELFLKTSWRKKKRSSDIAGGDKVTQ